MIRMYLSQVASHAQKYFTRLSGRTKRASRFTTIEESVFKHAVEDAMPVHASSGVTQAATSGGDNCIQQCFRALQDGDVLVRMSAQTRCRTSQVVAQTFCGQHGGPARQRPFSLFLHGGIV